MRKTIDLPDDLSVDLETMSKELRISQTTLLTIAGFQLVARYKMEGSRMFDNASNKGNIVTVDSGITSENVDFVRNHIEDFGTVVKIKVYGNQLPNQYQISKIQGVSKTIVKYRLILINNRGKEWWLAGCGCGYGGEGVSGTHEILTLLGIPFSREKLITSQAIEETVDADFGISLTVSKIDSDRELQYQITFRSAADLYKFKKGVSSLGYVGNPSLRVDHDLWAFNRHFSLTTYSKGMDDQTFEAWIKDTLERLVFGEFGGSIREFES